MVQEGFSSFWLYQYQVCLFADSFPFCCLKRLVLLSLSLSSEPLSWDFFVCLSVTVLRADCWHFNSSFSFSSFCTVVCILFSSSDPAGFFKQNWLLCVKSKLAAVRAKLAASHAQSLCVEQQVQLLLFCLSVSVKVASLSAHAFLCTCTHVLSFFLFICLFCHSACTFALRPYTWFEVVAWVLYELSY